MSEVLVTVSAGPAHRNSGLPSIVDVFGALYVGGSGMWRFTPIADYSGQDSDFIPVALSSEQNLPEEIKAGVAISLGLGDARSLAGGLEFVKGSKILEFEPDQLQQIAAQISTRGVGVVITTLDRGFLPDLEAALQTDDWSVTLCHEYSQNLQTQWNS